MGNAQHHVWQNAHAWFDHWLKGEQNGITNKKPVEVEIKFGRYEQFDSWPSTDISQKVLYLQIQFLYKNLYLFMCNYYKLQKRLMIILKRIKF